MSETDLNNGGIVHYSYARNIYLNEFEYWMWKKLPEELTASFSSYTTIQKHVDSFSHAVCSSYPQDVYKIENCSPEIIEQVKTAIRARGIRI